MAEHVARHQTRLPRALSRSLARRELPGLNALRAVSAYLVVFYHFDLHWVPGGLGVLAFFVLSGFLITWLLLKEHERHGTISLRGFYMRRSLRIFPAFYVYSAGVLVLLTLAHKRIVWPQTIAALAYVNNYYQALNGDPNTAFSHTWSLAIEEQFYLLWPLMFIWLARRRDTLVASLGLAVVAVWIHRWILVAHGVANGYVYEAFDTRVDHLLIGCALAIVLRAEWWSSLWSAVCSHAVAPLVTIGLLVCSSVLASHFSNYRDAIGFVLDPMLVAILVVQLIAFADHASWRWIDAPLVQFLGRISYSVYLYQQIMSSVIPSAMKGWAFHFQLAGYVTGVTLVAGLSYWIIETPFLAMKNKMAGAARAQTLSDDRIVAVGTLAKSTST